MNILLDTHVILWYLSGSKELPPKWLEAIENSRNLIFYSSISVAEIGIKHSIGKLQLPNNFLDFLFNGDWKELKFSKKHATGLFSMPLIHKDPFDRMLICQAIHSNLYLMTSDSFIKQYEVNIFL